MTRRHPDMRHPLGRACGTALPLVLLLLPYAMCRYWLDAHPQPRSLITSPLRRWRRRTEASRSGQPKRARSSNRRPL